MKKNISRKNKLKKNKSKRKGGDINRINNTYGYKFSEPVSGRDDSSEDEEDQNNLDAEEELLEWFRNTIGDIFIFENNRLTYNVNSINSININLFHALLEYYYDSLTALISDRNEQDGWLANLYNVRANLIIDTDLPSELNDGHRDILIQLQNALRIALHRNNGGKLKRKKKGGGETISKIIYGEPEKKTLPSTHSFADLVNSSSIPKIRKRIVIKGKNQDYEDDYIISDSVDENEKYNDLKKEMKKKVDKKSELDMILAKKYGKDVYQKNKSMRKRNEPLITHKSLTFGGKRKTKKKYKKSRK